MGKPLALSDLETEELKYLNFLKYCCFYLLKDNLIEKYIVGKDLNIDKNYELRAFYGII